MHVTLTGTCTQDRTFAPSPPRQAERLPAEPGCPAAQRQRGEEEELPSAGHSSSAEERGSGCLREPEQCPGLGRRSLPLRHGTRKHPHQKAGWLQSTFRQDQRLTSCQQRRPCLACCPQLGPAPCISPANTQGSADRSFRALAWQELPGEYEGVSPPRPPPTRLCCRVHSSPVWGGIGVAASRHTSSPRHMGLCALQASGQWESSSGSAPHLCGSVAADLNRHPCGHGSGNNSCDSCQRSHHHPLPPQRAGPQRRCHPGRTPAHGQRPHWG